MRDISRDEIRYSVESLEKESRFLQTRALVVLIASTWLIYTGMGVLSRFDQPYFSLVFFSILPVLNALVWAYWGILPFYPFSKTFDEEIDWTETDESLFRRHDKVSYVVKKQRARTRRIELLTATQFVILAVVWVFFSLFRF